MWLRTDVHTTGRKTIGRTICVAIGRFSFFRNPTFPFSTTQPRDTLFISKQNYLNKIKLKLKFENRRKVLTLEVSSGCIFFYSFLNSQTKPKVIACYVLTSYDIKKTLTCLRKKIKTQYINTSMLHLKKNCRNNLMSRVMCTKFVLYVLKNALIKCGFFRVQHTTLFVYTA